jgi:hypothetical protein
MNHSTSNRYHLYLRPPLQMSAMLFISTFPRRKAFMYVHKTCVYSFLRVIVLKLALVSLITVYSLNLVSRNCIDECDQATRFKCKIMDPPQCLLILTFFLLLLTLHPHRNKEPITNEILSQGALFIFGNPKEAFSNGEKISKFSL